MTPLIAFTAAWCAGIILAQAALISPLLFLLPLPFLPAAWWIRRESATVRWSLWLLTGLLLGAGRWLLAAPQIDPGHVAHYVGTGNVTLIGVVEAEPIPHRTSTHLRVAAEQLLLPDGTSVDLHGLVLIQAPRQTTAFYGDRIEAVGTLLRPPTFTSFDYRGYLARQGIHAMMRQGTTVTILDRHQRSRPVEAALRFKRMAVARLEAILPQPHAALLAGILLGAEWHIPQDLAEAFATTGTSHIIAISGFNLTIIAGLFSVLARTLVGRRHEAWVALGGLWLYTLFVGASAAVVRAAVMGSLLIIARRGQRRVHGPTLLAAAAWLMSLAHPTILWDVGFQLSLAATAGILLLQPDLSAWMEGLLRRLTSAEQAQRWLHLLEESFIVTLAAQITTTPILLATFHQLSMVTLLTNFLILPIQPYVMLFGGIALIAALLWLPLGRIIAMPAWGALDYTIRAVRMTARIPWAAIEVGHVALWMLWGYNALLLALLGWLHITPEERRRWLDTVRNRPGWQWALLVTTLMALFTLPGALPDGRMHLWSLPVEGNATLIRSPGGHYLLIDGAKDADRLLEAIDTHLPWFSRHLTMVILTAPQAEELPGLEAVVQRYRVDRILLPPIEGGSEAATFRTEVEGSGAEWRIAQQGDRWTVDDLELLVIWPPEGNVGPLVLRVAHGDIAVLYAPHATPPLEERLATLQPWVECELLLAPQHGGPAALTPAFLQATQPTMLLFDEPPSPQAHLRAREFTIAYGGTTEKEVAFISDGQRIWTRAEPLEESGRSTPP